MSQKTLIAIILLVMYLTPCMASPTQFNDTFTRYVSGHDFFRLLDHHFGEENRIGIAECNRINASNSEFLGVSKPESGKLTYAGPNPAFTTWYSKCLLQIIDRKLQQTYSRDVSMSVILPPKLQLGDVNATLWSNLNPEQKNSIISQLVTKYVGPAYTFDSSRLIAGLQSASNGATGSVYQNVRDLIFFISITEEFLTY